MGVRCARIPLRKYRERGATTVHPGNKAIIVSTQNGALQNCGGYKKGYKVRASPPIQKTEGPRLRAFLSSGGRI